GLAPAVMIDADIRATRRTAEGRVLVHPAGDLPDYDRTVQSLLVAALDAAEAELRLVHLAAPAAERLARLHLHQAQRQAEVHPQQLEKKVEVGLEVAGVDLGVHDLRLLAAQAAEDQ